MLLEEMRTPTLHPTSACRRNWGGGGEEEDDHDHNRRPGVGAGIEWCGKKTKEVGK